MFTISSKHGVFRVLLDAEDFAKAMNHKWHVAKAPHTFYVYTDIVVNGKRKSLGLHRLITDYPSGFSVDHINGNGLDNRKENLRVCTHKENSRNSRGGSSKGTYQKKSGRWAARIMIDGKTKYLGTFDTQEEAINEYNESALRHFGEFARLNVNGAEI